MQIYSTSLKMNWVLKNKFEPWFKKKKIFFNKDGQAQFFPYVWMDMP